MQADESLELLLHELLGNAFKHTNTPKVDISLSEDEDSVFIELQDYSPGLPKPVIESHSENKSQQSQIKGLTLFENIQKN